MYTFNLVLSTVYEILVIAEKILPGIVIALFAFGIAKFAGKKRELSRLQSLSDFISIWIGNSLEDAKKVNEMLSDNLVVFDCMDNPIPKFPMPDLDIKRVLEIPNDDLYQTLIGMRRNSKSYQVVFYNLIKGLKAFDLTTGDNLKKLVEVMNQTNAPNLQELHKKLEDCSIAELKFLEEFGQEHIQFKSELGAIIREKAQEQYSMERDLKYGNKKLELFEKYHINQKYHYYTYSVFQYTSALSVRKDMFLNFKQNMEAHILSVETQMAFIFNYQLSLSKLPFKKWTEFPA